jgi:hypothetical protein
MELTGEVCDVNPLLNSYSPIQEIPVARCCTVWTDQTDSMEYLLVGDQEAAGNINITKKIEYLIPTTCLSDVRVFEAKS